MDLWLSVFLNSAIYMIVGAVMVYVGMGVMFPKRRPPYVFFAYMLIKGLLWSLYDTSYVLGTMGVPEYLFQVVGTPILGVLSYIVLYYTWKGDFYKVGLGGFLLDAMMSAAMAPMFILGDQLFASASPFDYRGELGLTTLIECGGLAVLFLIFLYIGKPLFKWFRSYEFVHKNVWQVVVIASIVLATLPRMASTVQVARPIYVALALAGFLLLPLGGYMFSRARIERKRRALLENEVKLAKGYVNSIREQLPFLEDSAAQLDEVAAEVARVGRKMEDADLKRQVLRLSSLCNQLRHGMYSDSPVLDAVLTVEAKEFAEAGFRVAYHVSPLGDEAVTAAMVSQTMLSWVLDSSKAAKTQDNSRFGASYAQAADGGGVPTVEFKIIREGEQLVFVLNAPSNRRRRFPKRLLSERVPASDCLVMEVDDGVRKTIRALVVEERDAIMASAS